MAPVASRGRQARLEGLGKKKWEDTQANLRGGGRFSLSGKRGWCPISQPEGPAPPSPPRADNTSLSHVPDANSSPHHLGAQHLPSPPATSSTFLTSSAQSHQLSSSTLTRTRSFTTCHSQHLPSPPTSTAKSFPHYLIPAKHPPPQPVTATTFLDHLWV